MSHAEFVAFYERRFVTQIIKATESWNRRAWKQSAGSQFSRTKKRPVEASRHRSLIMQSSQRTLPFLLFPASVQMPASMRLTGAFCL